MYNLAFDTTAAACSIALFEDTEIKAEFRKSLDFGQSEMLIPEIKNLLEKQQMSFTDLEMITVCTGPGSFTGVRASISAARAFGIACPSLQICGVDAFSSYAIHWSLNPDAIGDYNIVLIETKREDFYYQIFDKSLKPLTEPSAGMTDEIIHQMRYKKVSFIGDGVERFLMKPTGLSLLAINSFDSLPIEYVGLSAYKQYRDKRIDFPKPLYLRAPDVCLKK